jgi:hypothetical protein
VSDDGAIAWIDPATVAVTREPYGRTLQPRFLYRVHWDDPDTGWPEVSSLVLYEIDSENLPENIPDTIVLGYTGAEVALRRAADRTLHAWLALIDAAPVQVDIIDEADYK